MTRYRQLGKGLLSIGLPLARAALPFIGKKLGKAVLGRIAGHGVASLFKKIIGGKRKRRTRLRRRARFRRYIK